jgi:hypothetical protein
MLWEICFHLAVFGLAVMAGLTLARWSVHVLLDIADGIAKLRGDSHGPRNTPRHRPHPESDVETPVHIQERIVAYRGWDVRVIEDLPLLTSPVQTTYVWEPGANHASCGLLHQWRAPFRHEAPGSHCVCGFHALHTPDLQRIQGTVIGAVALSGVVRVETDGVRGQSAEVVAIVRPPSGAYVGGDLDELARYYGVPVVDSIEHLTMVATEHGCTLDRIIAVTEERDG